MFGKSKKQEKAEDKKPLIKIEENRKYVNRELTEHTFTIKKIKEYFSVYDTCLTLSVDQYEELKEKMLNPMHEVIVDNKIIVSMPK